MAPNRKLAAIMVFDGVGYSRLVGQDEAGSLARFKAHRIAFAEPMIAKHHGRLVKQTGDGALVEFESAVDAVECAVAIQKGMAGREAGEPEDRRIRYRIGINIGDIVHEDDDIFGDGVNVAARLEALAEPGGVCIARNVYDQVKNKLAFGFEPIGEHQLKNITEPVTVYRVPLGARAAQSMHNDDHLAWSTRSHWYTAAVAVLVAIGIIAWQTLPNLSSPSDEVVEAGTDTPVDRGASDLPAEPSIAVLPFDNLSGNTETDYFSDGITRDIIIGLSRSPDLHVVARNSSFANKDQPIDVRELARELDVRYVLEGSLRASGDRLRITAQLIDATTGHYVWADRYDNQGTDVFALQDEVTTKIINTLVGDLGAIRKAEYDRAWAKNPTSLEEYDYLLRGMETFWRFTKQDMARARDVWLEGLRKFPQSGLLRTKLGWTYFQDVRNGWSSDPGGDLQQALELAQAALASENLPPLGKLYGHWLLADLYVWHKRDFESAIAAAETTLALYPKFPDSLASLCRVFLYGGRPEIALQNINEAIRGNPRPPGYYYRYKGWAYFMQDNYEEAIDWLKKSKRYEFPATRLLAASFAHLGRMDEAHTAVAELLEQYPDLTVAGLRDLLPYRNSEDLERELSGLGKAGLPESPPSGG